MVNKVNHFYVANAIAIINDYFLILFAYYLHGNNN